MRICGVRDGVGTIMHAMNSTGMHKMVAISSNLIKTSMQTIVGTWYQI